jgi:hypothetical protein
VVGPVSLVSTRQRYVSRLGEKAAMGRVAQSPGETEGPASLAEPFPQSISARGPEIAVIPAERNAGATSSWRSWRPV